VTGGIGRDAGKPRIGKFTTARLGARLGMCIMHRIGTTRTAALVAAFLAALAADLSAATAAEA
jgi:hypothetical protein